MPAQNQPEALALSPDPQDYELSFAATRPFDFHAWLTTWQREYVFFRVDNRGRINFIAPSVQAILGYEPEDLLGRDYREFFDLDHPLRLQLIDLSFRFATSDHPGVHRCVARRSNGELAFFSLREREIVGSAGVIGKEIMGEDVTASVEAELSLRQSERKYRRLVEGLSSDYVIFAQDADGIITYISPSARKVGGFEPEEVIGQHASVFYSDRKQGREIVERFRRESESGKLLHTFVAEFKMRNGTIRTFEVQERPVFGADGRFAGMEGIAKDVTEANTAAVEIRQLKEELERRVALRTEELSSINEDLRASEARYRDVLETQTEFIIRWKPDGTRTFVNAAYARYIGRPAEDLVGESFFPRVYPDDWDVFQRAIGAISVERPSVTYEIRGMRPGGALNWMQWTSRAFFDASGNPVEYQSVGRDVTDLREAADLLRQKEAHLAHLSRLATMGEMVAGIAHELGQPLHAAKTFAEAARRNLQVGGDERIATAIDCTVEISEAITRSGKIIRRLREFTKSRPVELQRLSINVVVQEAVELSAYQIRKVGVSLRLELGKSLPQFTGDRIQLEQLFVNLLVNACDAMEPVPRAERILAVQTELDGEDVKVSIKDSGIGISPEDAPRLFDAFYTTKKEGMGMGLSLCKSIAEAHGMDLRFEVNKGGGGLTFVLTIPPKGALFL